MIEILLQVFTMEVLTIQIIQNVVVDQFRHLNVFESENACPS